MNNWRLDPPASAHPEIAPMLATMIDGTREWVEELEDVTDEFLAWRPYPGGYCAGGLLMHMMSCDRLWIDKVILKTVPDATDPAMIYDELQSNSGGTWPDPPAESWDWYWELFQKHRRLTLEQLSAIQDPSAVVQEHERSDYSLAWIVAHLVQHDSYHGGQIVMLNQMWLKSRPISTW